MKRYGGSGKKGMRERDDKKVFIRSRIRCGSRAVRQSVLWSFMERVLPVKRCVTFHGQLFSVFRVTQ